MKHFFGLLLLASPLASSAQRLAPGTVALGGSINYYGASGSSTGSSSSASSSAVYRYSSTERQFGITPSVSYFVSRNLALGVSAGYSTYYLQQRTTTTAASVVNESVSTRSPAHTYSAGIFGQYYKMIGEQFGLTARLGVSYYQSSERGTIDDGSQGYYRAHHNTSQGYYLSLTPGVIFFPSKRLGLSLTMGSLGYDHTKSTSSDTSLDLNGELGTSRSEGTMDSFAARFGFDQLYLGGAYYFGR
jgi:hypothetical protein